MSTTTLNPTLDGRLRQTNGAGGSQTWASVIGATGNGEQDGADGGNFVIGFTTQTTDKEGWRLNTRYTYIFDTSSIPVGATITSVVFSIYGSGKTDGLSATPNINVYGATPASTVALVGSDYSNVGSTAYCDTPITYAGFSTTGYNDFTFNATGIAAINKGGTTCLCVRNANYDVAASTPPTPSTNTSSSISAYNFGETTTPNAKPKLVITYTTSSIKTVNGLAIASVKSKNGLAIASIKKFNGLE